MDPKFKLLEDLQSKLEEKDGLKEVEELLGISHIQRNTVSQKLAETITARQEELNRPKSSFGKNKLPNLEESNQYAEQAQ